MTEAGEFIYKEAFRNGLAWIPAGHILRMSPPIVMDLDAAAKCMEIIDEAIGEAERHFGYSPIEGGEAMSLTLRSGSSVRFGLIGCGLMGREFASAVARWCHLPEMEARPELVAVCDRFESKPPGFVNWYTGNFPSIRQVTSDYREVLANPEVDAVYIAVPHHLHQEFCCAALENGKHLMGEKPFGIDRAANQAIMAALGKQPGLLVRCSSEFPFFLLSRGWAR